MNGNIYISNHARQRVKDRCGTGKKAAATRMCALAIERGQNAADTKGSVKRWLNDQIRDINREIYIFGDKAYIYCTDQGDLVLVTVLQLPPEITRVYNRNRKKAAARAS